MKHFILENDVNLITGRNDDIKQLQDLEQAVGQESEDDSLTHGTTAARSSSSSFSQYISSSWVTGSGFFPDPTSMV